MKHSFSFYIKAFLQYRRERNDSPGTINNNKKTLRCFRDWCAEQGIFSPQQVTKKHIEAYCSSLLFHRTRKGTLLQETTRRQYITAVSVFFHWLYNNNDILADPTENLTLKAVYPMPGDCLNESEIEAIMSQPDLTRKKGVRDRTMLETFYATGIRCSELVGLRTIDLDLCNETLFISLGKGKKDRVVPIGNRCRHWLERYLRSVRPALLHSHDPGHIFLTHWGGPFKPDSVSEIVRFYLRGCGIKKRGACHLFRRTMATAMLENGADIRTVQEMLGHNSLRTTQKYTLLSSNSLKKVHHCCHPFEK